MYCIFHLVELITVYFFFLFKIILLQMTIGNPPHLYCCDIWVYPACITECKKKYCSFWFFFFQSCREHGQEHSLIRVGFVTYSNHLHFYNVKVNSSALWSIKYLSLLEVYRMITSALWDFAQYCLPHLVLPMFQCRLTWKSNSICKVNCVCSCCGQTHNALLKAS